MVLWHRRLLVGPSALLGTHEALERFVRLLGIENDSLNPGIDLGTMSSILVVARVL